MVKRKKEDFINYMGSVLQNSMLTGIPQIASASNAPKKILRAIVFVFCLVGFVYQSLEFMNMYWEYKTVIDIQVSNSKRAEMPGVTLCTNNGLEASKICDDPKYKDDCSLVTAYETDEFCDCMPNFCVDGVLQNITVPVMPVMDNFSYFEYEEYKPYLIPLKRLMLGCFSSFRDFTEYAKECKIDYHQNIRCLTDNLILLHACYTFHTVIGLPDEEPEEVSAETTEILYVDVVPEEHNLRLKDNELQISFHNSRNILNPYIYGHAIVKGHSHMFRLSKTVKHLLPPPYETNCRDYLTEWKSRGGRGPTNEKECIEECQRNSSMEILGCVMNMLEIPTNERICKYIATDERVLQKAHECVIEKCRPACYDVSYEVAKDTFNYAFMGSCFDSMGSRYDSVSKIKIKLDGMPTTTYTYSPKYQNIETFSYVGGYVGMWLGISLVAVFDFLETVVIMMKYPFRRLMVHRARKHKVDQIRKFQRNL